MVRLSVEIKDLFEDESRQHISGKQFVCHLLYFISRNGINALVELFEITFLSMVEVASAEGQTAHGCHRQWRAGLSTGAWQH